MKNKCSNPSRRIRLVAQYDGAAFQGWQRQAGAPTVQETLEDALFKLLGERITLYSAGRTDSGVHALAMPIHFDSAHPIPASKIAVAAQQYLPDGISLLESGDAPPHWDARRSARLRWYRYQILMSSVRRPLGPRAVRVFRKLNVRAIEAGLDILRGKHDFQGFRSSQCQAVRTVLDLDQASLLREGDLLALDFKCRSFLHHMVRFMAGTLIALGAGQIDLARLKRILDKGDRPQLVNCAPPEGLCLMAVGYSPEECAAIHAQNPAPPSF